ncbi:ROK family transcriptional regulator [Streptomyces goshikiensis]|uniref:ROK family transcriptional regulator n=1 Tax=Streptomyces goshikiensis TaxID=1942 RepID=UPI0022F3AFA4|nr:ROK family transcriptional regulator [Streptomyces goshikiensis]WBY20347.1 ROK family transcriptional regulator [Streptomyces goshikiensis]
MDTVSKAITANTATANGGVRGGVNLPALRGHNDALVLHLLRGAGPSGLGRSELAERTGLTPQAVSKITARLRGEGLVAEAGRGASTGGKPRTLLRLVPEARCAVGAHIDRDELRVVRVDLAGRVTADWREPLDFGAGPGVVLDAVADAVVRAFAHPESGAGPSPVLGVGIAAPGPLDWRTGVLGRVTGFPEWEGFPLREELAGRLGVAVVLDKDTNAGVGGADGGGDFGASVYLHVGTGLGAGLRLNGEVYRGVRSAAGEFGHQVLMLDGPVCRCGGRGCVEVLCLDAVARGDLAEAARVLGEAAANLVALLDVDRVVLGGRVVEAAAGVFVEGVAGALAGRGAVATVALAGRGVAEGAAELVLGPFFGRPA